MKINYNIDIFISEKSFMNKILCLCLSVCCFYENTLAVGIKLLGPDVYSNLEVVEGQSIPKRYIRFINLENSISTISIYSDEQMKKYDPLRINALQENVTDLNSTVKKDWDFSKFLNLKKLIITEPIHKLILPNSIEILQLGDTSSIVEDIIDLTEKDNLKVLISYSVFAKNLILPKNIIHLRLTGSSDHIRSNVVSSGNCSTLESLHINYNTWKFDQLDLSNLRSLRLEGEDMDSSIIDLSAYLNLRHIDVFFSANTKNYGLKKLVLPYYRPQNYEYQARIQVKSKDFLKRIEGNNEDKIDYVIGFESVHTRFGVDTDLDGEVTYLDEYDIKELMANPIVWPDSEESEYECSTTENTSNLDFLMEEASNRRDDCEDQLIEDILSRIDLSDCNNKQNSVLVKDVVVNPDFSFTISRSADG